ncbi:MAG: TadG family pilus assembly protein [Dongiaceae bacterium]
MWPAATRFARDERGGVLPLVGLSLTVILGFAALAIDVTHQRALDAQLEATADAAALAAASQLPDETKARETALAYAESNMPPDRHGTVLDEDDIVFGTWYEETRKFVADGPVTNAVQVTARRSEQNGNPAPTFFMRIFGRHQADLSAQSLAGAVLFRKSPRHGLGALSEEDLERLQEMKEALDAEVRHRWEAFGHDPDALLTDVEATEFLLEEYGQAVLLK